MQLPMPLLFAAMAALIMGQQANAATNPTTTAKLPAPQVFTPTAGQTQFQLDHVPLDLANVQLSVNGVMYAPDLQWKVDEKGLITWLSFSLDVVDTVLVYQVGG